MSVNVWSLSKRRSAGNTPDASGMSDEIRYFLTTRPLRILFGRNKDGAMQEDFLKDAQPINLFLLIPLKSQSFVVWVAGLTVVL